THETRNRGYEKVLADASALKASKTWIIGEDTPGVLLNCLGEAQRGPMADDPMHLVTYLKVEAKLNSGVIQQMWMPMFLIYK
ncbi:MAG: hypothetical protein NTX25_00480, partial [Proteobacteria bacterium]|nr:hypothetical protein [Pseudomonadota bacterium]